MRIVVKGLNYTEMLYRSKNSAQETVIFWLLKKPRKLNECGKWINGKRVVDGS